MMDFLNSFKSLIKLGQIRTDNNVFRLHYKLTVIMLIVFSLLLTSKQFFGEPIQCMIEDIRDVVETYCWIYGTYTLQSTLKDGPGKIPGMGTPKHYSQDIIRHKYYQWVCIVFSFQALMFYLPRYLWKTWEGGQLRVLVNDFCGPAVSPSWNAATKAQIVHSLLNRKTMHNIYAVRYAFCEFLNLLNVILQFFFLNWLLGGQFTFYGYNIAFGTEIQTDPMLQVFPKLTKCDFHKVGFSGTIENRDALCVLPLNVLNEKLFLILWFWLVALTGLTLIAWMYRICVICMPKLRVYLVMAQARCLTKKQAALIITKLSYGDFFLLYHIGKNVNPVVYSDVVGGLHETLKSKNPYPYYPSFEAQSI